MARLVEVRSFYIGGDRSGRLSSLRSRSLSGTSSFQSEPRIELEEVENNKPRSHLLISERFSVYLPILP
jgi:hypothetical protein